MNVTIDHAAELTVRWWDVDDWRALARRARAVLPQVDREGTPLSYHRPSAHVHAIYRSASLQIVVYALK